MDAIVNTVNTVGVMGKGLALQIKEAFPEVDAAYRAACRRGEVQVGRMLVVPTTSRAAPRFVINFPTKKHWRDPSRLEYVTSGLEELVKVVTELELRSIAVPPLGCGNGGLDCDRVKGLLVSALSSLDEVLVSRAIAREARLRSLKPRARLSVFFTGQLRAAAEVRYLGHKAAGERATVLRFGVSPFGQAAAELFQQKLLWEDGPRPEETAFELLGAALLDVAESRTESSRFDPYSNALDVILSPWE